MNGRKARALRKTTERTYAKTERQHIKRENFLTDQYGRELRRRKLKARDEKTAEDLDLLRGRVRDREMRERLAARQEAEKPLYDRLAEGAD